jgi:hypothetical protein
MSGQVAPAPNPNALYQRRWRERQKHPVIVVGHIEYERDAVLSALIRSERLSQAQAERRDLVERALSVVIAEWVEVNK